MRRVDSLALALVLVLGLAAAAGRAAPRPAGDADDRAEVATLDRDDPLVGRLAGIDPDGSLHLTLDSGEKARLPGASIVTVSFPAASSAPGPVRLELVGGDVLYGAIAEDRADGVVLSGAAFTRIVVPLERVRLLEIPAAIEALKERPLLGPAEGRDVVFRRLEAGVDRVTGTVDRIGPEGVTLETSLGRLTFGLDRVVAVAFSAPDPARAPDGPHHVVLAAEGSRLRGVIQEIAQDRLVLETPHGFTVALALAKVKTVLFQGGAFDFLSDLDPVEVAERSFFPGLVWNWQRDRTTTGNPLRLGGVEYPKGLGVHAYSALTYRLDGRYRRLRARIGIDDEVSRLQTRGAVVFRVLVDGKEVYTSPLVRGLEPPLTLPDLDLSGAGRLTLIADFGDDSHAGDRADWAMAILVRK